MNHNEKLPLLVWLVFPVAFALSQIWMQIYASTSTLTWWLDENGPIEIIQAMLMWCAVLIAVYALFHVSFKKRPWLALWLAIAALGCFFVAGEEISWGQFIFDWQTPEKWAEINADEETNLHQLTPWLNIKLKILLSVGIYIGGLLIPLAIFFKPGLGAHKISIIFPPAFLSVAAGCVLSLKIFKEICQSFDIVGLKRLSEMQETQIYIFILLYLIVMAQRVRG